MRHNFERWCELEECKLYQEEIRAFELADVAKQLRKHKAAKAQLKRADEIHGRRLGLLAALNKYREFR